MTKQSTLYLTLSTICFGIVWAIYEQFLSQMSLQAGQNIGSLIGFLSALGLFALIFQISMRLSDFVVQVWFSGEARLVGSWFQIFQIHNYTKSVDPRDAIRHGRITIGLSDGTLEITAENRKLDPTSTASAWHSNKVSIQGSQVWLLFSSTGPGRGSTHGNMLFQLHPHNRLNRKIYKLVGYFADSSPATHYGTIELFRLESEYLERLEKLSSLSSQTVSNHEA